jgi:hypothetical protein
MTWDCVAWSCVSVGFGAAAAGAAFVATVVCATVVSAVGGVAATVFALPPLGAGAAAVVVAGGTVA